jgi:mono/diheme cytochrome c family protein
VLVNHALWCLEGLDSLRAEDIMPLINQANGKLQVQALSTLYSIMNKTNYKQFLPLVNRLVDKSDTLIAPYLAFLSQTIKRFDPVYSNKLALKVATKYPNNKYVADAVVSTLKGKEEVFAKQVRSMIADTAMAINKSLQKVVNDIKNPKGRNDAQLKRDFPKGIPIYQTVCQTCHGADGSGVKSLAPPLNKSEWVTGDKNKLLAIVLQGLTGPVKVNGKLYKAPEINGEMPGIGNNKNYSDEDIAQLVSLIRKSWNNNADNVKATDVQAMRKKLAGRQKAFTVDELNKLK